MSENLTAVEQGDNVSLDALNTSDSDSEPRRTLFTVRRVFVALGVVASVVGVAALTRHEPQVEQSPDKVEADFTAQSKQLIGSLPTSDYLHDGNPCNPDEEPLLKLCYKKCSILTHGTHPIRNSAFSCCRSKPCTMFNTQVASYVPEPCSGYDVDTRGNCPHSYGSCMDNEEQFMNRCYKKCSALTAGTYFTRVGPATCCKAASLTTCLNLFNLKTRSAFNVGGDGKSHGPIQTLTEQ